MLKIVTIIGARPQFIKAAAVSRVIQKHNQAHRSNEKICEIMVHTGQHYDDNMSKIFFDELEIKTPDYNLGIGSGSHGRQTGKMLSAIEDVLESEKPDFVLTYGDTNSTLAGVLSASKLQIFSGHVEAGLRSFNRKMPEEINRIVADHISNLLFCPTETAVLNLRNEGIRIGDNESKESKLTIDSQLAFNVGDVMYDSILFNKELAAKKSNTLKKLNLLTSDGDVEPYCLVTVHRQENTDSKEKLEGILEGLVRISTYGVKVLFPIHPRTKKQIGKFGLDKKFSAIFRRSDNTEFTKEQLIIIPPLGYLDMIALEQNARCILTDSGGVQKEAFFLRVPCITLRNETEWTETVDSGWNKLVGTDPEKMAMIFELVIRSSKNSPPFLSFGTSENSQNLSQGSSYFGDGYAAHKIVQVITELL